LWTKKSHNTIDNIQIKRNYSKIVDASQIARKACMMQSILLLADAINQTYQVQLDEGMEKLPEVKGSIAKKYSGSGHGGYALYLFWTKYARDEFLKQPNTTKVEPYIKKVVENYK
jgi:hypothetical protein